MRESGIPAGEMDRAIAAGRELGSTLRLAMSRRNVSGSIGEKLGSSVGSSIEFQDFRDYQPGDDIRRIDWAAYARSDRLTLRLYREEVQPRVDIISDTSGSMLVPDEVKMLSGIMLAGMLCEASFRSGASVAWWGFGNGWQRIFPVTNSFPAGAAPDVKGPNSLGDEFARRTPELSRKGTRICISDLLWQENPEDIIAKLARDASCVFVINILSEEELDPPFNGPTTLLDSEYSERLDTNIGHAEKEAYKKRLETHLAMWKDACMAAGCLFCSLRSEDIREGSIQPLVAAGMIEYL